MDFIHYKDSDSFAKFPLKEKKYAKTRTNLILSFLKELESKSFEEIKIKDICHLADVSEPTFYNYFPEKEDLILHYIQIWSLQVSIFAQTKINSKAGYGLLHSLFRYTANESKKNPRILQEIISFQAKTKRALQKEDLTIAERVLLFPNIVDIERLPANGIEGIIQNALSHAGKSGELPESTHWKSLALTIASIFFGVPIIAFQLDEHLEKRWIESLNYVWVGAGGRLK